MRHSNTLKILAGALLLTFGLGALETTPAQEGKARPPRVAPPTVIAPPRPTDPTTILRSAKTIYVNSSSILVGEAVIEAKLRKRPEFQQLGLLITRDPTEADLVLELKHDLFTMYVYTAIDPSTNIVVATGKLSSLGGTVAGKVAKRFLKQMVKAR
jgi:hypothetical protein